VASIHALMVPNGCSTIWQRTRICSGVTVEPVLYRLKNGLVFPSRYPALPVQRAHVSFRRVRTPAYAAMMTLSARVSAARPKVS
jgi:hypothetical protein